MGEMHALKIAKVVEMAERARALLLAFGTVVDSALTTASCPWWHG